MTDLPDPLSFWLGQVWLEGDNTAYSHDSNSYGPVPVNLIEGKAVCVTWPQEWNLSRFFSKLPTKDVPHRRATDKEFVEWTKQKREYKKHKMIQWCEERADTESREKKRREDAMREEKMKEYEARRKFWEQFINELEVVFIQEHASQPHKPTTTD